MSTINNIGGVPIVSFFPQNGQVLTYNDGAQTQSGQPFYGPAVVPPAVVPEHRQALSQRASSITTYNQEVVLGRMTLNPGSQGIILGPFTSAVSIHVLGMLTGATPNFVVNLYDLGPPNAPIAAALRASTLAMFTVGAVSHTQKALSASPAFTAGVDILSDNRVYEFRGQLNGAGVDQMDVDWVGFVF